MKNIILIGNGFDLAHNLPTSYNDFVKFLALKAEANPNPNNLVTVSSVVNKNSYRSNVTYVEKNKTQNYIITSKNNLLIKICREINIENWCDIESLYFKELMKRTNQNVKSLHNEFQEIKVELEKYLAGLDKAEPINSFSSFFNKVSDIDDTLCLNFNYTNTFTELYNSKKIELINIHGELNSISNPIIFGYAATENENNELLNKGNNEFLKNIKTYHYNRTPIERTLSKYLEPNNELNVFILGHSCGTADINILNRILNHKKMKRIEIFYYENYDKYFDILINIRRVMSSSINYDRVTEFENSFRCPQYYDEKDSDKEKGFNAILNKITSKAILLKKRKTRAKLIT